VTAVLAECGNDIDAAIRRLNQLRIASDAAAAAQQQDQQQQAGQQQHGAREPQQQQQQDQASTSNAAAVAAAPAASAAAAEGPQTADQWIDALVGEMAQATNIPDARGRAGKLLHAFEQFVSARVVPQAGGAAPQLQARLDEAQRENAILKRAVQIQNARMQESATRDQELGALKQAVVQYQERLRHLELSNYSLALHLQKATGDAQVAPGHRPPDVY